MDNVTSDVYWDILFNIGMLMPVVGGFYIFYHRISYLFEKSNEEENENNGLNSKDLFDERSKDEVFRKSYTYNNTDE